MRTKATRSVIVWYVIADTTGPARAGGDTDAVHRFRRKVEADAFAVGRTWEGRPAIVRRDLVPVHLARRWGLA